MLVVESLLQRGSNNIPEAFSVTADGHRNSPHFIERYKNGKFHNCAFLKIQQKSEHLLSTPSEEKPGDLVFRYFSKGSTVTGKEFILIKAWETLPALTFHSLRECSRETPTYAIDGLQLSKADIGF